MFLTDWHTSWLHFTFPQTVSVLPIRSESHCLFSFLLVFLTIGSRSVFRHALCLGVLTKPDAIRQIISIINERFLISIHWAYIFSLFICLLTFFFIKKKHVVYMFSRGRPCIKTGFRTFLNPHSFSSFTTIRLWCSPAGLCFTFLISKRLLYLQAY